jgi:uncharacterized membrane protein YfcA
MNIIMNIVMTKIMIVEVATVMFVATVFRTTFGFGEALIAVPLLALIIPVQIAAPVAVLASILIAGFVVLRDWRHIHMKSAGWLISSTLIGIPFGLVILKAAPEVVVKTLLAILILIFSAHSLIFSSSRVFLKDDRLAWVFGFIAGVCGGSYGVNGPPLAIYGSLRRWPPERFRATLQGYFLPASVMGMCGYGLAGLWTHAVSTLFLWSLPAIIGGISVGRMASRKIDARRFEYYIRIGLILVASVLLFQALR